MNSNKYGARGTLKKVINLSVNQQEFEGYKVCKSSLFTSSSLHKHIREPS